MCDSPGEMPRTVHVLSTSRFDCSMARDSTRSMSGATSASSAAPALPAPPLLSSIFTLPSSNGMGLRFSRFWNVVSSSADRRRMWSLGSSSSSLGVIYDCWTLSCNIWFSLSNSSISMYSSWCETGDEYWWWLLYETQDPEGDRG